VWGSGPLPVSESDHGFVTGRVVFSYIYIYFIYLFLLFSFSFFWILNLGEILPKKLAKLEECTLKRKFQKFPNFLVEKLGNWRNKNH